MMKALSYQERFCALLGLPVWRLRREVVAEKPAAREGEHTAQRIPAAALRTLAEKSVPIPAESIPKAAAAAEMPVEKNSGEALHLEGVGKTYVYDRVTLIDMGALGTWWLPPVQYQAGTYHLFAGEAEGILLQNMLRVTGLENIALRLQKLDTQLSVHQGRPACFPPAREVLLSLSSPWLVCGAVAEAVCSEWAAEKEALSLHHPLRLLKMPHEKRSAWQQLLVYKKVLHD